MTSDLSFLEDLSVPVEVARAYNSIQLKSGVDTEDAQSVLSWPDEHSMVRAIRHLAPQAGELGHHYLLSRMQSASCLSTSIHSQNAKLRVGIVGGGISGLVFATQLSSLGLEVTVFDEKPKVGGTWAGPHYPGQRVDIAGHVYWPVQFGTSSWKSVFPTALELAGFLETHTMKLDGLCRFAFNSKVHALTWQAPKATWKVDFYNPQSKLISEEYFDFVVLAPGKLSSPVTPLGPTDQGTIGQHSSSLCASSLDLRKPICVVGSAASGIQLATELAMSGHKVHLFQRSPSWILHTPSYRKESNSLIRELQKTNPLFALLYRLFFVGKSVRGNLDSVTVDSDALVPGSIVSGKNSYWRLELEDYIKSRTLGSELPDEWLIPNYPPGSKRLVLDDGEYLSAILDRRITLHGDIDIRGLRDVRTLLRNANSTPENLVWATGFHPSAWTESFSVTGESKESLKDLVYKSGLHYKGVMVPGYPNLFLAWGPNTNVVVSGSNTHMMEIQAEFAGKVIKAMARAGCTRVSVGRKESEEYGSQIALKSEGFVWGANSVNSWYKTPEGLSIENWPGDTAGYFKELMVETLEGLEFQ